MSRSSTLIILGVLVMLVPFSGLPVALRALLAVIFGACILGIGFTLRTRETRRTAPSVEAPVQTLPTEPAAPSGVSPI